ncbi:NUDIX hydrolase [Chitinophaga horti]|uniref:GDP-mannose pyrophosphatase n=1 Tax=Chitinophaga horti TaxID=2920382 RepID=A0ABY6J8B6_9BACT|nr:NUDIX hydrolase [Chitinophaga horti]UYQ94389.1 NUDIX hydrolase [Chitinophaga horti]
MEPTQNPWTILSQELKYDNKWISVTEHQVLNPAGGPGIYGVVSFKNLAIGVIALDDDMNTYLVGQYRFPLEAYSWEIPEGGGPYEEDPLISAKRELLEETGLVAHSWKPIIQMHLSNSVSDEVALVFLARNLEQHKATPEDTEDITVRKLPFEEAYQMVKEYKITDSISVAAIQKIRLMMLEGEL